MFDQWLFLIFFIYGLAFFGLGIAMLLESGRSPGLAVSRALRPLAIFGLIHGTHEWLESYLLQARALGMLLSNWLTILRLVLLISSFSSLFIFAYQSLQIFSLYSPIQRTTLHIASFGLYAASILFSAGWTYRFIPSPWLALLDGLARYLLAVPASLLSAVALRAQGRQARKENRVQLGNYLWIAAAGFSLYCLTQLFVHPLEMFPARFLNEETFLAFSGIPIQAVRTVMAVTITIGLLRAVQVMEEERKSELFIAQQARLDALKQQENLRRELLRHIVQAQEDERARIARELHDETAQVLSAFTLELGTLRANLRKRPPISHSLDKLQDLSLQMSQGLYRMVHDLRPAQLDDLGLVPALRYLLDQDYHPKGLNVQLEVEGMMQRLDPLVETVLFRVTQEALNNVVRHARTDQAHIRLVYTSDRIELLVMDPGKGFDPNESFLEPRGWGLAGMRERVESVEGEFNLASAPNEGTLVKVAIPTYERREHGNNIDAS